MTTIILDGLDPRTNREQVESYCQSFGRLLNCYIKSSQCTVTFANPSQAEQFLQSSPHRLDSYSYATARSKTSIQPQSSTISKSSSIDQSRLIVSGTGEQLNEKSLIDYFSRYGSVRMCQIFSKDSYAIITFDQNESCERVLKQSRHFLHGRSLTIEIYSSNRKRRRSSSPPPPPVMDNPVHNQMQAQLQWHDYEKKQWQEQMIKQQFEQQQQMIYYQNLMKQLADEIVKKEQHIEQLKNENRDIE